VAELPAPMLPAPRVLITTAMVVPEWSDQDTFRRLEDAGLTMYGQMTAAGWFYIGTQGILGFTYETFRAIAAKHFGGPLSGPRPLTPGPGGLGFRLAHLGLWLLGTRAASLKRLARTNPVGRSSRPRQSANRIRALHVVTQIDRGARWSLTMLFELGRALS